MTKEQKNLKAALDSGAVQAWADGKQIQYEEYEGKWTDADGRWANFTATCKWRVKPEPEPLLERWCVVRVGCDPQLGYVSLQEAQAFADKVLGFRIVHMREVREEK
jgi:hypothetical protein